MSEYKDHIDYMLKKQNNSISLWNKIMLRTGSWSDFEKPVTVEPDSNSSQKAESTEDKSTTDQDIHFKSPVKQTKKQMRFPRGRIDD